jgi:hypothetical protein
MTFLRQIKANRCNATKSTGPKTTAGKMRSRRNAVRHGLSAETVIEIVEDVEDYQGFEAAIIADYDARTAVERELVLRLASLFWRLRRATAIETDLFRIQAEILHDRRQALNWRAGRSKGHLLFSMVQSFTLHKAMKTAAIGGKPQALAAILRLKTQRISSRYGNSPCASSGLRTLITEYSNVSEGTSQRWHAKLSKPSFCCKQLEGAETWGQQVCLDVNTDRLLTDQSRHGVMMTEAAFRGQYKINAVAARSNSCPAPHRQE